MGIVASGFARAAVADGWHGLGRGPKLRQLFGAYQNQDCWAVQRRFRQIDNGDGYVGYEELQQLVGAEEFSLLFLWDIFSQQNELMDIKELLTVVCLFSSARLEEKGKFLLAVFDESKCSICTGEEVAQLCAAMLGVLARCTGGPAVKVKDVGAALKEDLPEFVPAYKEAIALVGPDAAFRKERVIHHSEVVRLLAPIQHAYERLPMSRAPPAESPPPPPPDWGIIVGADAPAAARSKVAPQHGSSAMELATSAPQEAEPHLAWLRRMEEDDLGAVGSGSPSAADKPVRSWMLMHGANFSAIAKDLVGFRQAFVRSVATSVGLPSSSIEVVNVAFGPDGPGSTLVEFLLHSAGASQDGRSLSTLVLLLEQQLSSRHSALRKSELGTHLSDAELLAGEPQRKLPAAAAAAASARALSSAPLSPPMSPLGAGAGEAGREAAGADSADDGGEGNAGPPRAAEQGTQSDSMELLTSPWPMRRPAAPRESEEDPAQQEELRAAWRSLDAARRRAEKAEAAQLMVEEKLRQKDALVAELRVALEAAQAA